jgi:hypothetical protein
VDLRLWRLQDWRVALGDAQIAEHRDRLLTEAVAARSRRESGERPLLGVATDVAAEILSYRPEEAVPVRYAELINAALTRVMPEELVVYNIAAAVAALVLEEPDGMRLRRRLWPRRAGAPASNDIR